MFLGFLNSNLDLRSLVRSMLYQAKQFIKFRRKAYNQHGVHSPFVYELVTQCFYDTEDKNYYKPLTSYRKRLLQNHSMIEVTDLGAGSRVFKSNLRKISAIAQHAGATTKRSQLLARLVHYFEPTEVLELGTSLGIASMALSSHPSVQLTTLEGCPQTAAIAGNEMRVSGRNNVEVIVGGFHNSLTAGSESTEQSLPQTFDLVYFDGNHSKEATLEYVDLLLPTIQNDTVWIFDDIHWSVEMTEAWHHIQEMKEVSVTIDCFWLGFVFFRKEQAKEHFQIRLKR